MSAKTIGAIGLAGTGALGAGALIAYIGKLTTEYGLALGILMFCLGAVCFALAWVVQDSRKARIAFSKDAKEMQEKYDGRIMELFDRQERRADLMLQSIDNNTRALTVLSTKSEVRHGI